MLYLLDHICEPSDLGVTNTSDGHQNTTLGSHYRLRPGVSATPCKNLEATADVDRNLEVWEPLSSSSAKDSTIHLSTFQMIPSLAKESTSVSGREIC